LLVGLFVCFLVNWWFGWLVGCLLWLFGCLAVGLFGCSVVFLIGLLVVGMQAWFAF
jgi:hypothetical protein